MKLIVCVSLLLCCSIAAPASAATGGWGGVAAAGGASSGAAGGWGGAAGAAGGWGGDAGGAGGWGGAAGAAGGWGGAAVPTKPPTPACNTDKDSYCSYYAGSYPCSDPWMQENCGTTCCEVPQLSCKANVDEWCPYWIKNGYPCSHEWTVANCASSCCDQIVAEIDMVPGVFDVEIPTDDGEVMVGQLTVPAGAKAGETPAVLLHAGATHVKKYVQDWAADIAAQGYMVLATNPYTKEEAAAVKAGTASFQLVGKYLQNPAMTHAKYLNMFDFLKSRGGNPNKLLVAGFCFGGWGALEIAKLNIPGVLGVVSMHGSFSNLSPAPDKIKARVLVLHGADDQNTNTVDNIGKELKAAGATYETTMFGFVVHSYTDPEVGYKIPSGGFMDAAYNPYAAERAYQSTMNFFQDVLAENGAPYSYAVAAGDLATLVEEKVTYKDGETELEGYVYYQKNSANSTKPGIVVSHAWGGLHEHEKNVAQRLALQGYVGFAHSVYTPEETASATSFENRIALSSKYSADLELYKGRMLSAVGFLGQHSQVDGSRIVVSGYCFGGGSSLVTLNLNLPEVVGVVSFHGSLNANMDEIKYPLHTRVLVLHGVDDGNINDGPRGNNSMVQADLEKTLDKSKANWELTKYSDTGHGFTEPSSPDYNILTDRRSFATYLDFLSSVFSEARTCVQNGNMCSGTAMESGAECSCSSDCLKIGNCCRSFYVDCFYYNK